MRIVIILFSLMLLSTAQAQDIMQDDLKGFLYIKKEFGGAEKRDNELKFGFTVDHTYAPIDRMTGRQILTSVEYRQSLVDIEFSPRTKFFSRFNIGGIDALTYKTVMNQNGETSRWPMGLSTTQVVIGGIVAIAGGYLIYEEVADDGDEEGDVDTNDEED